MKVAILGCGVVGSGVAKLLLDSRKRIAERFGFDIELKWIVERNDLSGSPLFVYQAESFEQVLADDDTQVVVETMGGINAALAFTKSCLNAGKHVVTSNKELVSCHGPELLNIAKLNSVFYLYEAAVGGGIPLLRSIRQDMPGNEIRHLAGILNGTCNYILEAMEASGRDFDTALSDAQELGYAERDPSADIDGLDTMRKLAILISRITGVYVPPDNIPVSGIRNVGLREIRFASKIGAKLKLIAYMQRSRNGEIVARVEPYFVDSKHPLFIVNGVYNALLIDSEVLGNTMYYGRGAGSMPTAGSVMADILSITLTTYRGEGAEVWHVEENLDWGRGDGEAIEAYAFVKASKQPDKMKDASFLTAVGGEWIEFDGEQVLKIGSKAVISEAQVTEAIEVAGLENDLWMIRCLPLADSLVEQNVDE